MYSLAALWPLLAPPELSAAISNSSEWLVKSWTMDDGVPNTLVTVIGQSEDGYIWLGTGSGLTRFDGVRFVTEGLEYPKARPLYHYKAQGFWCTDPEAGLLRWENGHFKRVPLPGGLTGANVAVGDSRGITWLHIDSEKKLYGWRDGKWLTVSEAGEVPFYAVYGREGLPGEWWCNHNMTGVPGRWKNGEFQPARDNDGETATRLSTILPRAAGGAWLLNGTPESSYTLSIVSSALKILDRVAVPWEANVFIQDLWEDSRGNFWISSGSHGVLRFGPDGAWEQFDARHGLATDSARLMMEDREGNVWIATDGGGLYRLSRRTFRTYGAEDGLTTINIYSVAGAQSGGIWIGAHGNRGEGVFRWFNGRATHTVGMGPYAWSVYENSAGELWAGNYGDGLYHMRDGKVQRVPGSPADIFAICDDGDGGIWYGGAGVGRVHNGRATRLRGITNVVMSALARDQNDVVWAGSRRDGLYSIELGEVTRYTTKHGLLSDAILSLYVDRENHLWIGSENGLTRRVDGKFIHLTQEDGLIPKSVSGIAEDGVGNVWIHSRTGISRMNRRELDEFFAGRIKQVVSSGYGREDGLATGTSTDRTQPRICQDREGRMWFTTLKGAAVVDPKSMPMHTNPPPVVIEEVVVDGKLHGRPMISSMNQREDGISRDQEFKPGLRQVTIRFTANSLTAPEKLRFRYRLHGLTLGWTEIGDRRDVTFGHLTHGEYRFEVTARTSNGVWTDPGAVFAFRVLPFFWETMEFKIGFSVVALAIAGAIVRSVSTRQLRRRLVLAEKQAAVESERARISRDMHDELGARLTKISVLGELAKRSMKPEGDARQHLDKLSNLATETSESLGELIWTVKPANDSVRNLANHLCQQVEEYIRDTDIRCRFEVDEVQNEAMVPSEVRRQVVLGVKEAINNVVKHSGASEVSLRMQIVGGKLVCSIADNGKGLPSDITPRAGGGNGLPSLRQRFEHLRGRCEISNLQTGGVLVEITVPFAQF